MTTVAKDETSGESTIVLQELKDSEKTTELSLDERMHAQGVPKADVIEDVPEYLKRKGLELDAATKEIQELYGKYKTVENAIQERRSRLLANLPDFENSLNYIETAKAAKEKGKTELRMLYKLDENAYQRAKIDDLEKVVLLLGSNTFAEFTLDEAKELLTSNINGINRVMELLKEELNWVRDQITTCEVSIAHLYNYGVVQKKAAQPKA
ncbi:unnamed protein product [Bursaphelenchus xylophilus]|uniref:Prefoldin subunit 3 n=1 Tax=Bursaphelenchus xylophilus TaxID=6326 RepID=A0A1I7S701_BURXY|nr:unnamed protein product [Bursaphelenchus xylophilus]CAG9079502.1 unnamed protein product [Bursaphelenchus xylophilus]